MGLFGKKQDPDQEKLSRRTPEIQAQIDASFESLKQRTDSQGPSFKLIMNMTSAENAKAQRLIAPPRVGGPDVTTVLCNGISSAICLSAC